ncbi:MAG: alkaline phosphatase family protein [Planctomycetota bacterium]|jgi:hypothetical protein
MLRSSLTILLLTLPACRSAEPQPPLNLVLVTIDGLRWQEFFGGAQTALIDAEIGGVADPEATRQRFLRETPVESRELLLPFLWTQLAKQGQVFGADDEAPARMSNALNFSYPGYAEMICGIADPRVRSNDPKPNPNPTVFGYLNQQPAFAGRVAVVASWDVFPWIHDSANNGVFAQAGWNPLPGPREDADLQAINARMAGLPHIWPTARFDAITIDAALLYLERMRPRLLHLAFDETDEWGHERRYDLYLDAAQRTDGFIERLWNKLQSMGQYRDRTVLLITTDHGRGELGEWTEHGAMVRGADRIWLAVMGPGVPARGMRGEAVTGAQIAASIAELLGEDFSVAQPRAAPALPLGN